MSAKHWLRFAFRSVPALAIVFAATSPAAAETVPDPVVLPGKLTLPAAVTLFRERGLDLMIADAAILSARADERAAGAIPNPTLTVGVGKSFGGDPASSSSVSWQAGIAD